MRTANNGFLPEDGPDGSNDRAQPDWAKNPQRRRLHVHVEITFRTALTMRAFGIMRLPPLVNNKSYYSMMADYLFNHLPTNLPAAGGNSIWVCPTAGSPESMYGNTGMGGNRGHQWQPVRCILPHAARRRCKTHSLPATISGSTGTNTAPKPPNNYKLTPYPYPFYQCYVMNSKLFTSLINGVNITHVKLAQLRPGSDVVIMTEKIMQYGECQYSTDPEVLQLLCK